MNINVSEIIAEKLAQLEADGTIKRKIEEALEKSLMSAITEAAFKSRFVKASAMWQRTVAFRPTTASLPSG